MKYLLPLLLLANICQASIPIYKRTQCVSAILKPFYDVACEDAIFKIYDYYEDADGGVVYFINTYYKNVKTGCPESLRIDEKAITTVIPCPKDFK